MANNRAYLWCPQCKEFVFLGATMCDGYSALGERQAQYRRVGVRVLVFLSEHEACSTFVDARQVELRFEHHNDKARELPDDCSDRQPCRAAYEAGP